MSTHSLDGQWRFRVAGALRGKAPRDLGLDRWMPAAMPGTIHYQLQKLGKIPDPFYGRNELDLQWIDEQDWELARTVKVSPKDVSKVRQELVFDGIDTVAEIFLNGKKVGQSFNMFRQVVLDVRGKLKAGPNEIRVLLKSPTRYAWAQAKADHYRVNTDKEFKWETGEHRESRRAYIRKVQCQFGWDWGVYLAVSGLWLPSRLECSNAARIASVQIRQIHQGPPENPEKVTLKVLARLETPVSRKGTLIVECGGERAEQAVSLKAGENTLRGSLTLRKPKLWWPAGQGDPNCYDLYVAWNDEDGDISEIEKRYGLRTIELVTQKDKVGKSFYFKVNGRPIFMKGADWIPADAFQDRCTEERYRHILASMVEANMNMVRVWGGGQYEPDVFYDLCDELGILVWHDFMMACAVYPDNPGFIRELTEEARYQVRRLSDHACIAIWAGDNENLGAVKHWWQDQPERPRYPKMYRKVMDALWKTCESEDPTRRFWLSSPSNGDYSGDPDDPRFGDVHYWKVWHGGRPFEDYLTVKPRFASEFGFQSFPEPRTLDAVIPKAERNPSSWYMEHHQRSPKGNLLITNTLAREMPIPKDFESFCYASQINQAMAIRTAVEHWRRLRPWCMGTLYWQVNDLWPVASWSSMDYHGRWKVLHHEARRFYFPLLVSFRREDEEISVWATSDLPKTITLRGHLESMTWQGTIVHRAALKGRLKPGESRCLLTVPVERLLNGMHPREVVCFARVEGEGYQTGNYTTLVPWKWARVEKPVLHLSLRKSQDGLELRVKSRNVVPFFHAELKELEGHFSRDWKVLKPGEETVFTWVPHTQGKTRALSLAEARKRLKTLSFYDLFDH